MPSSHFFRCTDFGCKGRFDTMKELKDHQDATKHTGWKKVNLLPQTAVINPGATSCPNCGKMHQPGTKCE